MERARQLREPTSLYDIAVQLNRNENKLKAQKQHQIELKEQLGRLNMRQEEQMQTIGRLERGQGEIRQRILELPENNGN